MFFPCPTFCPEVSAIYHCVITSAIARWAVSGSVSGTNSFSTNDPIACFSHNTYIVMFVYKSNVC